jgi:hypothetical protein
MAPGGHKTSAVPCNLVGALLGNALTDVTRPERALVFVARRREEHRGGRGTVTTIYTHTLHAGGAASAIQPTGCWGQEAAAEPCRGIATWV